MKIKIVFFGSTSYPIPILDSLIEDNEIEISLIITPPDKIIGRKKTLEQNPVKEWAVKNNIKYLLLDTFQGENLTTAINKIKKINPDLGLVGYFGLFIPKKIYDIPKYKTINIHFSLLPKYKGPAPLQHAIKNNDKETGISILKITENFDAGEIIYQEKIPLIGNETPSQLYRFLFEKTSAFLPKIIKKFIKKELRPYPQKVIKQSYAPKLKTYDAKINWSKKPEQIDSLIRAVNPNPGAWTNIKINPQTSTLKILKIIKTHLDNKQLIIDEVQLEGKKSVSFKQFKEGYPEFMFI